MPWFWLTTSVVALTMASHRPPPSPRKPLKFTGLTRQTLSFLIAWTPRQVDRFVRTEKTQAQTQTPAQTRKHKHKQVCNIVKWIGSTFNKEKRNWNRKVICIYRPAKCRVRALYGCAGTEGTETRTGSWRSPTHEVRMLSWWLMRYDVELMRCSLSNRRWLCIFTKGFSLLHGQNLLTNC